MLPKKLLLTATLAVPCCWSTNPVQALDHITLGVTELNSSNDSLTSVTPPATVETLNVSTLDGVPTMAFVGGSRGDFEVRVGEERNDDDITGVLLSNVAQNSSASWLVDPLGVEDRRYAIAGSARTASGYYIATHDAFTASEWNVNVAAAYFPFAENWIAGHALGPDNGAFTSISGLPGLDLGDEFIDGFPGGNIGRHTLDLSNFGVVDHARQGLLFVSGGVNGANFALSGVSSDGSQLNIYTRAVDAAEVPDHQQRSVAFAYIPAGIEGITMGKVSGQGGIIFQQGDFTVTRTPGASPNDPGNDGVYTLTIAGQSPTTGTLIFSPESAGSGASGDNMVTAEPNGQGGWTFTSRDTPVSENQPGLQNVGNTVPAFNFAFIPNNINENGTLDGSVKPLTNWDTSLQSVYGGNIEVTEYTPNNENGDNDAVVTSGSPTVRVPYVNRGDYAIVVDNAFARSNEGVLFATVTQNNRDNSGTGGLSGAGIVATTIAGGKWEIATHTHDGNVNGEQNIDFATLYVQTHAIYRPTANTAATFTAATLSSGVDSKSEVIVTPANASDINDGVLLATAYGNTDKYTTVGIDGNSWKVEVFDNSGLAVDASATNHLYVPFADSETVAARISATGTTLAGDAGDFTMTNPSTGIYHLTIDGVTPNDGMLLLNSALSSGVIDNETRTSGAQMSYEAGSGALAGTFIIQALGVAIDNEMVIDPEMGSVYSLVNTPFSFAYFDFGAVEASGLTGDYNGDGTVNLADYTVWRDNLGSDASVFAEGSRDLDSTGVISNADYQAWKANYGQTMSGLATNVGTANVPEPATCIVLVVGLAGACFARRRLVK